MRQLPVQHFLKIIEKIGHFIRDRIHKIHLKYIWVIQFLKKKMDTSTRQNELRIAQIQMGDPKIFEIFENEM